METISKNCSKCTSSEGCNAYCDAQMGENIVNFVNSIDTVSTSIGDLRQEKTGEYIYAVTGFAVENSDLRFPINILTEIKNMKSLVKGKLEGRLGATAQQCLLAYINQKNLSLTVKQQALEDFKRFNGNKILPVPVRPGADIEVRIVGFDGKIKKVMTSIRFVRWMLNNSTGELEGWVVSTLTRDQLGENANRFELCDYGKSWTLPNLEISLKTAEIRHDAIRMNKTGLIQPLEISFNDTTIAVDCAHEYLVKNGIATIIGDWGSSGMVERDEYAKALKNNKAFKEAKVCIPFLARHRKFIIPYGMSEANVITLSK